MALVINDRVQQTGTANTTVSFTLSGAVIGFQSFAVIGNGNTTYYSATDVSGNWEVGIGTYATGGTLTRTTILASSNTGSAVTFVGTVNVFVTYPAEKSINYDGAGVATIGTTLSYADTGIVGSFASTVAGYNQVILQNKSTATNASSNLNVSNDAGTASTNYAELGINSSTFSNGAGCFNIPNAAYVASAGEDLSIGTYGSYKIHFATNSNTTDSMTIYTTGGISLGTYGDPGLGNVAGNKFVPGFTSITSAAGVTVLTAASTYYQRLVGTAIQTIQLPDATTCLVGTTFIFDNDSTGVLTITDGATGAIDTIPSGGIDYIYLISNGTVAGTWARYALLPSSYDFSATSANFGGSTISNALWNGTTIASGYGGTGLTTFTAANNALYSTSAGALAAGTLPVLAGGTGTTTPAIVAGTNISVSGTWPNQTITNTYTPSATVASFSAGTTGFTPSTATTGAVALAGTLVASNGGTGLAGTLTGFAYMNGTGAYTAATTAQSLTLMGAANTTTSGYLTTTDWNTFNGKQATLVSGTNIKTVNSTTILGTGDISVGVTAVSGTAPVVSSGGATPAISMAAATTSVSGYLTSTDWNTFNGKQAAGSYVTVGGALGTPSSGTLTNCTFPTLNQNTTGSSGSCTGNAATATTATNLSGFTNSNSSNPVAGPDNLTNNGLAYVTGVSLFGQTDGALYAQAYSTSWVHQIYGDYRTGQLAVRGKNSGTWQSWRTVLDSSNYTSYAPSLTGTGASGSWGINVTGNAATVTTVTQANIAGAVAPSTSGNVLTSNGSAWTSAAPSGGSGLLLNIQYFTATATYTATSGTTFVVVEVVGGGGTGGTNAATGSGGGGGGFARKKITSSFSGVTVTVGSSGGTSSFGALVSATGGSTGGTYATGGGAGGLGSSGDLNIKGQGGGTGVTNAGGGNGGSSHYGGGANGTSSSGLTGGQYGGGGSGSSTTGSGGAGASGVVIVYEYK